MVQYFRVASRSKLADGEFINVGDFIQAFSDDEAEFGEVLSMFQFVAVTGNKQNGLTMIHVRWGFPLFMSPDEFKKHIPLDHRQFFNSNFESMACNVIKPFVFTSGAKDTKWENTDVLFLSEVKRLVFMHSLPHLKMPRAPVPRRGVLPTSISRLLFLNAILNAIVSFPREVYVDHILNDPYVKKIQEVDYVEMARHVHSRN